MPLSTPNNLSTSETVGETLDRLAVFSGKIGMNSPEQALALLRGLDDAYERMQSLEIGSQSRRLAQVQLDEILAQLHREAAQFIRDLGGVQVLRQARQEANPPEDHTWWYLDDYLAEKRRQTLRHLLTAAAVVVVALVILGAVYRRFLAPSPQVLARYNSEQTAQQLLTEGDLAGALAQVDEGLKGSPGDANLLILKGVIQEAQGETSQAAQSYAAAEKSLPNREDFLVTRGQNYLLAGRFEQALADAQQAVQINPDSAQAYLLMGQSHEQLRLYREALDDYDKAFQAANKINQPALAAIARQHTAMLLQSVGVLPTSEATPVQ